MTPWWVAPAAVVIAAVVSATALVIVRKIKGPVTIQDLWAENRQLRTDLDAVSRKVDTLVRRGETQLNVTRIYREANTAHEAAIDRHVAEGGTRPTLTRAETEAIERARRLDADETIWNTAPLTAEEAP